jgi:hypothetical protein
MEHCYLINFYCSITYKASFIKQFSEFLQMDSHMTHPDLETVTDFFQLLSPLFLKCNDYLKYEVFYEAGPLLLEPHLQSEIQNMSK